MKLKILNNTLFFDNKKQKINTIENLTYGKFIIHLNGLWIINNIISYDLGYVTSKNRYPFTFM